MFVNWFIVLFKAQTPQGLHDFITGYLRYATWVEAYVLLAANPFPGFYLLIGSTYHYPVDLEFDPPARQNRWKTFFRLFLAIPAMTIASLLLWGGARGGGYSVGGGLAFGIAFLLWWVGLIQGRSPRGLRDLTSLLRRLLRPALGLPLPRHRPLPVHRPERVLWHGRGDRGAGSAEDLGARDRSHRG